jgi:hypothetical protein
VCVVIILCLILQAIMLVALAFIMIGWDPIDILNIVIPNHIAGVIDNVVGFVVDNVG